MIACVIKRILIKIIYIKKIVLTILMAGVFAVRRQKLWTLCIMELRMRIK